jgi:hypothetical protein
VLQRNSFRTCRELSRKAGASNASLIKQYSIYRRAIIGKTGVSANPCRRDIGFDNRDPPVNLVYVY